MTDTKIKSGIYNCPNCGAAATPESVRCAYCHSALATRVCALCYGAIFPGMKHCPWCGEDAATGKSAEWAQGKCPRCTAAFVGILVGDRMLGECPACGGLWVDNDTFQEICTNQEKQEAVMGFLPEPMTAAGPTAPPSARTYVPCPKCNKLMNRRQFAGCSRVIVDWCKAHGTWFDRDELRQIVQFILDGGLKKSREREQLQLEEARQNLREEKRNFERLNRLPIDPNFGVSRASFDAELFSVLGGIWRSLKSGN